MTRSRISDVWFRTDRSLAEIAEAIGLRGPEFDGESYWEWVIGRFRSTGLDITRTHTCPPLEADTRVFLVGGGWFSDRLVRALVARLRPIAEGEIRCGRWVYLRGNDYDKRTVKAFGSEDPPLAQ